MTILNPENVSLCDARAFHVNILHVDQKAVKCTTCKQLYLWYVLAFYSQTRTDEPLRTSAWEARQGLETRSATSFKTRFSAKFPGANESKSRVNTQVMSCHKNYQLDL